MSCLIQDGPAAMAALGYTRTFLQLHTTTEFPSSPTVSYILYTDLLLIGGEIQPRHFPRAIHEPPTVVHYHIALLDQRDSNNFFVLESSPFKIAHIQNGAIDLILLRGSNPRATPRISPSILRR